MPRRMSMNVSRPDMGEEVLEEAMIVRLGGREICLLKIHILRRQRKKYDFYPIYRLTFWIFIGDAVFCTVILEYYNKCFLFVLSP